MLENQLLEHLEKIVGEQIDRRAAEKEKREKIESAPLTRSRKWRWLIPMGVVSLLGIFGYLEKQIHKLEKKQKEARHSFKAFKARCDFNSSPFWKNPYPDAAAQCSFC